MKKAHKDLYKKAISKFGEIAQIEMLNEEALELALAVRKYLRHRGNKNIMAKEVELAKDHKTAERIAREYHLKTAKYTKHLAEEVCDVSIMLEQLFLMHPEVFKWVESIKAQKIQHIREITCDSHDYSQSDECSKCGKEYLPF